LKHTYTNTHKKEVRTSMDAVGVARVENNNEEQEQEQEREEEEEEEEPTHFPIDANDSGWCTMKV